MSDVQKKREADTILWRSVLTFGLPRSSCAEADTKAVANTTMLMNAFLFILFNDLYFAEITRIMRSSREARILRTPEDRIEVSNDHERNPNADLLSR